MINDHSKKKTIKYVGFYNATDFKRNGALSATKKMDYVSDTLVELGFEVNIINPSWCIRDVNKLTKDKGSVRTLRSNVLLKTFSSWSSKFKLISIFNIIYSQLALFFTLIKDTRKGESIIVYHSPWLYYPIRYARIIRKFKVILEVEEIYQTVNQLSRRLTAWENGLLIEGHSYIAVSESVAKKLNSTKNKIVLYGTYNIPTIGIKNSKLAPYFTNSQYINVVYAGAVDRNKGGAFKLLESIKYLKPNIKVFILGYGEYKLLSEVKEYIYLNNLAQRVSLLDPLHDDDFYCFLSNCHIGINSQIVGDYMDSAFPSKILTYLSNGLNVVSTPIQSIQDSPFSSFIHFTNSDDAKDIALTLNTCQLMDKTAVQDNIVKFHESFKNELHFILKK